MSDVSQQGPDLQRQGELINEISSLVPMEIEGPWRVATWTCCALSMLAEDRLIVERPDGSIDRSQGVPLEVGDLQDDLRAVMYAPGSGTWLSATWVITDNGDESLHAEVEFNYDEEPAWSSPVRAFNYALDLEDFPRDEEAIPAWMRAKVVEAQTAPE
ncbi:MAG: hypothetical protein ACRDS9_11615 [Pseudonocardiaceae bacterium]